MIAFRLWTEGDDGTPRGDLEMGGTTAGDAACRLAGRGSFLALSSGITRVVNPGRDERFSGTRCGADHEPLATARPQGW